MILTNDTSTQYDPRFDEGHYMQDQFGNVIGDWSDSPPPPKVDIGMSDLHKYIKNWMITRVDVPADSAIEQAIHDRWPGMSAMEVLFSAECNQLQQERMNMVRDANNNQSKWIDTTVQGDLFNNMNDRVPRFIVVDGKPVEYWKVSPLEILEYKRSLVASLMSEEKALLDAAATKRQMIIATEADIEKTLRIIEKAKSSGVDPASVRYEKKD